LIPKSNCLISRGIGRRNNWLGYAKDYPLTVAMRMDIIIDRLGSLALIH